MNKIILFVVLFISFSCNDILAEKKEKKQKREAKTTETEKSFFSLKVRLSKELKEISGITRDGNFIWAISDKPKANIYKLDLEGKIIQELQLNDVKFSDVEDVTVDTEYLYIADVGDNDGTRSERQIIKIKKSAIGNDDKVEVTGEIIRFTFPDQGDVKKKENEFDCEALIASGDHLYLFTKRRNDNHTEVFKIPKETGLQQPSFFGLFDTKGMITGASINEAGTEVALVGYQKGHFFPFVWILSGFTENNFFNGQQEHFVLTKEKVDWQIEGITYKDDQSLYIASEQTSDVPATLNLLTKEQLNEISGMTK